jgi:hypothetical protein
LTSSAHTAPRALAVIRLAAALLADVIDQRAVDADRRVRGDAGTEVAL